MERNQRRFLNKNWRRKPRQKLDEETFEKVFAENSEEIIYLAIEKRLRETDSPAEQNTSKSFTIICCGKGFLTI